MVTGSAVTVVTKSGLSLGSGIDGVMTVVYATRMLVVMKLVLVEVVISPSPQ